MKKETDREWEIFVHNVKWLRKHYGLSRKQMAERLNISVWMLTKIERGQLPPSLIIDIFFVIQDQFGVHPAEQLTHRLGE